MNKKERKQVEELLQEALNTLDGAGWAVVQANATRGVRIITGEAVADTWTRACNVVKLAARLAGLSEEWIHDYIKSATPKALRQL